MKFCLIIYFLVLLTLHFINGQLDDAEWKRFKETFNKSYGSPASELERFKIWKEHKAKVDEHNKNFEMDKVDYKQGINAYSDMTSSEFNTHFLGYEEEKPQLGAFYNKLVYEPARKVPREIDWREKGAVTKVKSQARCGSCKPRHFHFPFSIFLFSGKCRILGSCYAFSAAGSIEGQYFIATRKLVSLSEQQIVDCSQAFGNNGCNGGSMEAAFRSVIKVGGIEKESFYEYIARDTQKCMFHGYHAGAKINDYANIDSNEAALQQAVAFKGPVSVAIHVSPQLDKYESGVFSGDCIGKINHAVLVVGYGETSSGKEYWLVKNSWVS